MSEPDFSPANMAVSVKLDEYQIEQNADGVVRVLRHGSLWRDCTGDKLVLGMAYEIDSLRKQLEGASRPSVAPAKEIKPEDVHLRMHLDANKATPVLAGMLARLLHNAGASVTFSDHRLASAEALSPSAFAGLNIHIDRLTRVHQDEAERWFDTAHYRITGPTSL